MQGIWILDADLGVTRPRSKKQVRELIASDPARVIVEATSVFGNEYDGPASDLPVGQHVTFVGPSPYTRRSFYGELIHTTDGRWTVK